MPSLSLPFLPTKSSFLPLLSPKVPRLHLFLCTKMAVPAFLCFGPGPLAVVAAVMVLASPVHGQISSPCTASMVSSFAPCMNFVTNSSANGTAPSPTAACCSSLQSLTSSSIGCLCLILTGSVPVQLPINRTLAISLPRACNRASVPVQCNASIAPIPAPGPVSLVPSAGGPTGAPPSPSPTASSVPESNSNLSPALTPVSDTTPVLSPSSNLSPALTPVSDTTPVLSPTSPAGSHPTITPSGASRSFNFPRALLILVFGVKFLMKYR